MQATHNNNNNSKHLWPHSRCSLYNYFCIGGIWSVYESFCHPRLMDSVLCPGTEVNPFPWIYPNDYFTEFTKGLERWKDSHCSAATKLKLNVRQLLFRSFCFYHLGPSAHPTLPSGFLLLKKELAPFQFFLLNSQLYSASSPQSQVSVGACRQGLWDSQHSGLISILIPNILGWVTKPVPFSCWWPQPLAQKLLLTQLSLGPVWPLLGFLFAQASFELNGPSMLSNFFVSAQSSPSVRRRDL